MTGRRARVGLAVAGLLAMAWGGWLVLTGGRATDPFGVAVWLLAVVVVHDLVLAPAVVGLGFLTARTLRGRWLARAQATFVVCAAVAVTSAPLWLGQLLHRLPTANTSVDPWDYPRNLLVVVGGVIAASVALAGLRKARNVRPSRDHRSSSR